MNTFILWQVIKYREICIKYNQYLKKLYSHMIKRILHSWSFHMKFIKLAKGSFNKFHMK